jgi:hypothetical protein
MNAAAVIERAWLPCHLSDLNKLREHPINGSLQMRSANQQNPCEVDDKITRKLLDILQQQPELERASPVYPGFKTAVKG